MELDHYLGIMFEATEECWNAEKESIIEMLESAHVSERIIE